MQPPDVNLRSTTAQQQQRAAATEPSSRLDHRDCASRSKQATAFPLTNESIPVPQAVSPPFDSPHDKAYAHAIGEPDQSAEHKPDRCAHSPDTRPHTTVWNRSPLTRARINTILAGRPDLQSKSAILCPVPTGRHTAS
jgi:hypothetical protein